MDPGGLSGPLGVTQHLSELRIVLLGAEESGKSSVGNIILGKQEFTPGIKTLACKKVQVNIAGRQVTVVDTPGWVSYFPVEYSRELLKHQIVQSASLCPPGPHTFLLVIDLDSTFHEEHLKAVQEHLALFSDTVWRHTILLFTSLDAVKEMTIEQQAHQMLIEKCGNRYHILCIKNSSEASQVSELLEMIEKMVAGNSGCHFHMERKLLQDMEEKRRIIEERANQRVKNVSEHRLILQDLLKGQTSRPSELKVVLLGWVAGGKSSTGNTILGREEFGVWRRTAQCEKKQGEVNGRQITVVDTPGWWKFMPAKLTPDWIKQEVLNSLMLCHPGPHAILLVIPADTSFKEEQRKIIRDNMEHLGEKVWGHTLVLFTWGEYLGNSSIEQHIEREGQALQWLIEKCGNRYHVLSNARRGDRTQVTELLEKIEEMVAGGTVFQLKTQTQSEVIEEIEEMDRETRGIDLSTEKRKITELMQIIDELWITREERLLERLSLDFPQGTDSEIEARQHGRIRSRGVHPVHFHRMFEKQCSGRESAMKIRPESAFTEEDQKKKTDSTIERRSTENGHVIEKERSRGASSTMLEGSSPSKRRREAAEEREVRQNSTGADGSDQKDKQQLAQTAQWMTEKTLVFLHNEIKQIFEKEWSRKEDMINEKVRTEVKSYIIPPAKESSMDHPLTNLRGDASSEVDTSDVTSSCIKVCDWLREKHSDITGRDERLEHCGTEASVI